MVSSRSNDDFYSGFELKTVLETSRLLVESRDSEFIINNLLLILMGRLLVTKAALFIYDSVTGNYLLKGVKGFTAIKVDEVIPIVSEEGQRQKSWFPLSEASDEFPAIAAEPEKSLLFNLRTSNNHHGFLLIGSRASGNEFSLQDIEFAEALCIISTAALVNSELFNELNKTYRNLDRRIHELNTLFDLSKEFNLLVDREKISRIFKFALLGQLFIRTFFLIYKNQERTTLLSSSGIKTEPDPSAIEEIFENANDDILIIDKHFRNSYPWLKEHEISMLFTVSIQNRKVAVIGVGERANQIPFNESDINFLRSLANLAVISIQKTYFLEERIDKERMEEELSIAKSIQKGLFPDPVPVVSGIDFSVTSISSREVGGDYFDVATTPDGNTIFAIADVTGKGVPAALLMANLQSMLHVLLPVEISLSEATERINNLIFKNTPSDKFITFFWAKYLSTHKILRYVNAGHNPPLLLRNNSTDFEELNKGGLLLGALETLTPYEQSDVQLNPGDILVCYTDGIDEAPHPENEEEYGTERLRQIILKSRNLSSSQLMNAIVEDVNAYCENRLIDDLTLMVIKADA
ncbi:MAG: serine/threonine-protein phosphatase [Balneolaceae bacterium]|nr:MAG: serine/threonine-protein phosphatase [Balneolaceae bacterium]